VYEGSLYRRGSDAIRRDIRPTGIDNSRAFSAVMSLIPQKNNADLVLCTQRGGPTTRGDLDYWPFPARRVDLGSQQDACPGIRPSAVVVKNAQLFRVRCEARRPHEGLSHGLTPELQHRSCPQTCRATPNILGVPRYPWLSSDFRR
jgi:hypothetical protein